MSSISNGHPTLKSWCWATLLFDAIFYFVLHTASSVSRRFRMLSIRKILHNNQICLLQSMSSAIKRIRMLSTRKILFNNQICLLQSVSSESRCFRMLSIRKTLFRIQIFLLRSFSYFERFLTADQPFPVDNYCDPRAFGIHSPLRHLESQPPFDLFWRLSITASSRQNVSENVAKLSDLFEISILPHRTS